MAIALGSKILRQFVHSKKALALPVTFLILLVSTLGIISVTYYFSLERINSQSRSLKTSVAEQDFLSLDNAILSILCDPGSSATFDLRDSDGAIIIQPLTNNLTISINDAQSIQSTLFDAPVGQIAYRLSYLGSITTGTYLKGDSRPVVNQSGAPLTQLYVAMTNYAPEIQLSYRPAVSYANAGTVDGKAVTDIRIYIINLNSSDAITQQGEFPLRATCTSTQLTSNTYSVDYQAETLEISVQLGSTAGVVKIPVSNTSQGAVINIETVISSISIEKSVR